MAYLVNEDYELGCKDSTQADVDLSGCMPSCFTPTKATNLKAGGKNVLTGLTITVTAATGSITTSLIDGSTVTFVSASGSIQGNATKVKSGGSAVCLDGEDGSTGTLTVVGTNTQSGVTVTEPCKIWFSDAGQDKASGK